MLRKVLALLILLMCLAATECGPPRISEQRDVPQISDRSENVTVNEAVSTSEAPQRTLSLNESDRPTDVLKDVGDIQGEHKTDSPAPGSQQENSTKSGLDETEPQVQTNSSAEVPGEDKQDQELASDGTQQLQNTSTQEQLQNKPLQHTGEQERHNVSADSRDEAERQNKDEVPTPPSSDGHEELQLALTTKTNKLHKTSTIKQYLPKASKPKATSLKDFHEDSPRDVKQGQNEGDKAAQEPRHSEQKQQGSSVVLSGTGHESQQLDGSSSAPEDSPEHFVPSSSAHQEASTQEYYDPHLYARPHVAEDLVTTNNALDLKPSITTYSGFKPSFPVRTAIPAQYAVTEEHPDDLAPHHFAVNGALPYALDRAQFIQYQQAARRFPYLVRVPADRRFSVQYPVLVERKSQSFTLPLKVLVPQPVVVQAEDKVLYPATKPFTFRVQHGSAPSSDVQDGLGKSPA